MAQSNGNMTGSDDRGVGADNPSSASNLIAAVISTVYSSASSEEEIDGADDTQEAQLSNATKREVRRVQSMGGHFHLFEIGQRVFYIDGEEKSHKARIKNIDYDDELHTYYTIEVNGREVRNVHHVDLSVVHPTVDKILGIVNLRDETDNYLREKYPTLKEFENFLKLSFVEVKAIYKKNGESKTKEPRFKRSDREEFIILCRWTEKNQVEGKIKWKIFNEENFNDFREQAPKEDLFEILKELGIYNYKVKNTLEAKSVQTPAHFAQKPKSWYDKLCEEESGTEENSKQTKHLLLSGAEKSEIEKFKDWYEFYSIGYLPSDWIVSFRNNDVHPNERDLRKVLRVIGLNADAIEALKMNDIKDIATLNRTSKEWKTQGASRSFLSFIGSGYTEQNDGERASRSNEWEYMGLTRNDASDIISFRHWHNFYVAGKRDMKGWTAEFNSAQYNNFLQRYEPGDDFRKPIPWKFWQQDTLNFSQQRHDYYDMLQKAAESGDVTEEQRYHFLKYMEKREKMSLIEEITSRHYEGLGDSTQEEDRLRELLRYDEQRADEMDKGDLLFSQKFCQFFFSAFLVLVLLTSWTGTTAYFMMESLRVENEGKAYKQHPGFDYVTFIHNVLFGLVTAVVIQELGEEAKDTSLYHRFLPTYRDQRRRQKEHRILNRKYASICKGLRSQILEGSKTYLMGLILWSTRLYIIVWICLGAASLAFGAIKGIGTSNPLYTTGQTWLGIAVTIGYTYFGLSGKVAPKLEDANNNKIDYSNRDAAVRGTIDGGSNGANGREEGRFTDWRDETRSSVIKTYHELANETDRSKDAAQKGGANGDSEAKYTDERGEAKVVKTHHELMKKMDHYDAQLNEAVGDKRFKDAVGHQNCLDQLDKLKPMFPTLAELESQLAETEEKMRATAGRQDYVTAEKFHKDVVKLKKKLKEEEDAAAAKPHRLYNVSHYKPPTEKKNTAASSSLKPKLDF